MWPRLAQGGRPGWTAARAALQPPSRSPASCPTLYHHGRNHNHPASEHNSRVCFRCPESAVCKLSGKENVCRRGQSLVRPWAKPWPNPSPHPNPSPDLIPSPTPALLLIQSSDPERLWRRSTTVARRAVSTRSTLRMKPSWPGASARAMCSSCGTKAPRAAQAWPGLLEPCTMYPGRHHRHSGLQPCVVGCHRICHRLQPFLPQAATIRA